MNDEAKSRMFLLSTTGFALLGLAVILSVIPALRQFGMPSWRAGIIGILASLGIGILSVCFSARLWKC